jgi:hypothetical protein
MDWAPHIQALIDRGVDRDYFGSESSAPPTLCEGQTWLFIVNGSVRVETISSVFKSTAPSPSGVFRRATSEAQVHFVGGFVVEKGPPLPPNMSSSMTRWDSGQSILLSGAHAPWAPPALLSSWESYSS